MERSVKHLIVDSGAFIRNAAIKDIGESVYSLRDVIAEIRDKATRQRLQVLPYEIIFREPSTESIRRVTDFSKQTGDYPSLSATDIRVMALAYQLEREHVGTEHIREKPDRNITWNTTTRHLENPTEIAGFYLKKKDGSSRSSSRAVSESHTDCPPLEDISDDISGIDISSEHREQTVDESRTENTTKPENTDDKVTTDTADSTSPQVQIEIVDQECKQSENSPVPSMVPRGLTEGDQLSSADLEEESDGESVEEDDNDDDDDDDGWITPSNIKQIRVSMGDKNVEKASVTVGCLTTDFAMQNVLIQMGLNVVSVAGMLVKRAKSYVLRCHGCFKITTNMTKEFCFHCGNKTLQKVSMTVEEDGSIRYFLSKRRPVSTRGMKYSLPAPKGGKHAVNPILAPDQRSAHQRQAGRGKVSYDVFDPDYVAHNSPFAPTDTHSRSAQLGVRQHKNNFRSKRNPNENKHNSGRRK